MLSKKLLIYYIVLKMLPDLKIKYKHEMEVYHGQYADAQIKDLSKFL